MFQAASAAQPCALRRRHGHFDKCCQASGAPACRRPLHYSRDWSAFESSATRGDNLRTPCLNRPLLAEAGGVALARSRAMCGGGGLESVALCRAARRHVAPSQAGPREV
eukprot:353987-Chlamydomonas_euryale.AAC.4